MLPKVFAASDFVAQACVQHPELLRDLAGTGDLLRAYEAGELAQRLARELAQVEDEAALKARLRGLRRRERVMPGIIGYDDTVLPEIENGVLAGHHMVFLGERGQAKSRIIRSLVELLDEFVPAVGGWGGVEGAGGYSDIVSRSCNVKRISNRECWRPSCIQFANSQ